MGIRGELFSTRVGCEGRTYFFNVKENRMGDLYLTVVESKPNETEGFERRSVVVFKDDLPAFIKAFQGALDFVEKSGAPSGAKAPRLGQSGDLPARRRPTPEGFTGAEAGTESGAGKPKKRVVVKRRPKPTQA